jgi:predicted transcriptional regulator
MSAATGKPAPTGPRLTHPDGTATRKELEICARIAATIRRHSVAPTARELAAELELTDVTVYLHLKSLRRKGYLAYDGRYIVEVAEQ